MTSSPTTSPNGASGGGTRSLVPARMDRLPWTRFHWSIVVGLGFSWVLDGLEIQIVASAGFQADLGLTAAEVGLLGTIYLVGQVFGALIFGRMADSLGRKKLFILTLAIYLVASAIAGLSPNFVFLAVFRFFAGAGIGGEYAAINSAIDLFAENVGWRIGFFIGPVLGLAIIYLRRHIPESPRWLMTHGREKEAEATVDDIEARVEKDEGTGHLTPVSDDQAIEVVAAGRIGFGTIIRTLVHDYPKRTFVGAAMMITQSFLYNAIFFTYALVLQNFYGTSPSSTQYFFLIFAVGNLLGPLVLGPLFDSWGRRQMIFLTYAVSAAVLAVSAILFQADVLNAATQTAFWSVSFFFASAGASSAYLTVSEIFPLELRSQVIGYFFALGQIVGAVAPSLYGALIGDGSDRGPLTGGYFLGAGVMLVGGVIALIFGVDAARKSLETITTPLSVVPASKEPPRR
jgi:MFS family permease